MNNHNKEEIVEACRSALQSADTLSDALQACKGLFPSIAVENFMKIDKVKTHRLIGDARYRMPRKAQNYQSSFVLSTWDFTEETCSTIAKTLFIPNTRVILLGCPTLSSYLPPQDIEFPHIELDLFRLSAKRDDIISLICDINVLTGSEFGDLCQLCFLDPPWYSETFLSWIGRSLSFLRKEGKIAFPLLGKFTRPSAVSDRVQLLRYCENMGLHCEIYEEVLVYDVPQFEECILSRAGIPAVEWKRADLVVATLDSLGTDAQHQKLPSAKPFGLFKQVRLGSVAIDVLIDRYESSGALIKQPAEGYWMKSPSRREQDNQNCNVFTSNGAHFMSDRPADLISFLNYLVRKFPQAECLQAASHLGIPPDVLL
jgi:hypothetical protein